MKLTPITLTPHSYSKQERAFESNKYNIYQDRLVTLDVNKK
jgi:hypothetical protein